MGNKVGGSAPRMGKSCTITVLGVTDFSFTWSRPCSDTDVSNHSTNISAQESGFSSF